MDKFKETDKRIIDFLLSNAILTEEELWRILEHRIAEALRLQERLLHGEESHDNLHVLALDYEKHFSHRYGRTASGGQRYRRYHPYLEN